MSYVPGRGPCYRCLFPEAPDGVVPNCAQAGVLGVLPGVLGTIQATEAIKLILGVGEPLVGRLLTYDALEMRFHEFPFERRHDCAVCGDRPTITEPRDVARAVQRCGAGIRSQADCHGLADAARSKPSRERTLVLVDVREPREFDTGHLEGAINIPVTELQRRLEEIAPQASPVFICRSGSRSLAACAIARARGNRSARAPRGGASRLGVRSRPDARSRRRRLTAEHSHAHTRRSIQGRFRGCLLPRSRKNRAAGGHTEVRLAVPGGPRSGNELSARMASGRQSEIIFSGACSGGNDGRKGRRRRCAHEVRRAADQELSCTRTGHCPCVGAAYAPHRPCGHRTCRGECRICAPAADA